MVLADLGPLRLVMIMPIRLWDCASVGAIRTALRA
jgi:hypothetical protein